MQINITWREWLTVSVLVLFFYYLSLACIFYRKRKQMASGRSDGNGTQPGDEKPTGSNEIYTAVQELLDEVKSVFASRLLPVDKTDLLASLQRKIMKYPELKNSPYRDALNHHIISKAQNHYQLSVSFNEVDRLWRPH